MTDQPEPADVAGAPIGSRALEPGEPHESKERRLLFAIVLTLFGLVLVVSSPGSAQIGLLVAVLGLLVGLSGL